ncbi:MBL fold metallo-hydrolase [Brevibacillus choshinensis]|uniref:MBL fold metallo-hydrolase n=1 Tax=Brevibacillus choshinensis TaxID=54911 RepID=A0ABR5NBG0_BRECH|nr:MBL fold metallo-hydrolase [Brevibacillus choshinensis]KQL48887.1 MBL fold metallo-hydrolase [Brevibacillus choshinensis]
MYASEGIKVIKLEMKVEGGLFVVHTGLLWDENEAILVDTGIPGQLDVIKSVVEQESIPFQKLKKIIITHQDRDHIGSLPEIVEAFDGAIQVCAHEVAIPYLAGETPLIKSGALVPPVKVDQILQDGDILPYCGGIQVIYTPGHSPDHISLYHIPSKTLISGDALTAQEGVLMPFNPDFTPDKATALQSLAKLVDLEIETVIAYHGGVCTGGIKERLLEIIESTPV